MSEDIQSVKGTTKRNQPGGTGANPQLVPLLGIVKDNVDPTRAGRIFVYLANNSGLNPEDRSNWRPVKFLSPFFGFTQGDAAQDNFGNFKNNPSSYGMWSSPPDIGTTVLCLFVNGDLNYGFYIGCVPEPESLQMVPAIGSVDNIVPNKGEAASYGGALRLPVTNINKNNKAIADTADYLKAAKPIHSYASSIMFQQGILRDPIRGPISSSSQRETPSRVGWGVSTPGRPIYEGGFDDTSISENLDKSKEKQLRVISRRGGHTIVMDDGDIIGRDNLVRIRTSLGHQILMSDDGQTLMILHSNGQSYVELGKEGTVDIYSTNSINLRTQGDLNLHADNDVNIHATKNLNLQGDNIHINSEKEYKLRVGTDYSSSTGGKHTTKVTGAYSVNSGGQASMASGAEAFVNGSKVNLNSGQTSTQPAEVPAIEKTLHTDTLFDDKKGFLAAPAKLVSITSRAPAHAPWSNAGQGVDLKTDLNASSQLPSSPSSTVSATNATAAAAGIVNPVNAATVASSPANAAASKALDGNMTKAITGQIATGAANGPLANAVTQGTAIAQTTQGLTVGVGKFAQTPQQLETAGILKPGSAALVNSVAAVTGNVQAAMPNSLFTGKSGAENLSSLVQNVGAQTESVIKNIQVAQTALQNSGAITGSESGTELGGMVLSTSQNGLNDTIGAIKGSVSQLGGGIAGALAAGGGSTSALTGKLSGALKDISAGNFAAKIGENAAGALGGLQASVESMIKSPSLDSVINQAAGAAAGAFSAISSSIPNMQAGVPQNLTEIAKKSAAATETTSLAASSNAINQAAGSLSSLAKNKLSTATNVLSQQVAGAAANALGSNAQKLSAVLSNKGSIADSLVGAANTAQSLVTSVRSTTDNVTDILSAGPASLSTASDLIRNPASAIDSLTQTAQTVNAGVLSAGAGSLASGLNNLPGGASAVSSITNLAKSSVPKLPGTADLKSAITGSATDALNKLGSSLSGKASDLLGKTLGQSGGLAGLLPKGLPSGAAAQLQSALGSIAAAGSGVKIPSIGLNTTDRGSINSAVTSQLDDPGIPAPNFGEVSEASISKVQSIDNDRSAEIERGAQAALKYDKAQNARDKAFKALEKARKKLPQGDPGINSAQEAYNAAYYAADDARKEFQKTREELRQKGYI